MDKVNILKAVDAEIKKQFFGEGTGHDFWHIDRVRKIALKIGKEENADLFVVELAALLHDIADYKFHNGDFSKGGKVTRELLLKHQVEQDIIDRVCDIVDNVSYKGALDKTTMVSIEGKVVQDADRIDALGAIGIARAFATGGHFGVAMHDPYTKPHLHRSKEEYAKVRSSTINHFYEKLLLLKDRMNTETGKRLAAERHKYMEEYLERFYKEWRGEI